MRILTLRILFIFCVIGLVQSCKLSDEDKETVIRVTPEFSLELFEELGSTRQFQIHIKTVDPQPCEFDKIDYSSNKINNKLLLSLHEIIPSSECISNNAAFISAVATFGFLEYQSYDVEITLKNVVHNLGKLTVSPDAYVLDLETLDGIELEHSVLWRVPTGYFWGYVAYKSKDTGGEPADTFMAELNSITSSQPLSDGYYGYFDINENDQLVLKSPPDFDYFKTFYFKYDGTVEELQAFVKSHRENQNEQELKIAIFTSDGKTI